MKNILSPSIILYRSEAQYSALSLSGSTIMCNPSLTVSENTAHLAERMSPEQHISMEEDSFPERTAEVSELIFILPLLLKIC